MQDCCNWKSIMDFPASSVGATTVSGKGEVTDSGIVFSEDSQLVVMDKLEMTLSDDLSDIIDSFKGMSLPVDILPDRSTFADFRSCLGISSVW